MRSLEITPKNKLEEPSDGDKEGACERLSHEERRIDGVDMRSCCFEYLFKDNYGWLHHC